MFVDDPAIADARRTDIARHRVAPRRLSAASFIEGSITRRGEYRRELGFLKPLLSRAFLEAHALHYAEDMRLSEDYDLYARALIAGARFRIAPGCGYVAVERPGSLSGRHGERDLLAAEQAAARLLGQAEDDPALRRALRRQHAQVARKRRHRTMLARKQAVGTVRALAEQARHPAHLLGVLADTARDKWTAARTPAEPPTRPPLRFLL